MEETKEQKEFDFAKFIETCSEHDLYFLIDEAGAFIWRTNEMVAHGRIPEDAIENVTKDIISVNKMQGQAAERSARFGVDFKIVEGFNDALQQSYKTPCPDYWKWLKHWNDWRDQFTDETWAAFTNAVEKNEPIEEFLPKKRWNE